MKIFLIALTAIFLTGCYKQVKGNLKSSHDSSGKVYSFAQIEIVDASELKTHLKKKLLEDKTSLERELEASISGSLESLRKYQNSLNRLNDSLTIGASAVGYYGSTWQEKKRFDDDSRKLNSEMELTGSLGLQISKEFATLSQAIKTKENRLLNLKNGRDGKFYFSDAIGKKYENSDSTGNFEIGYFAYGKKYLLIRSVSESWCLRLDGTESFLYLSDSDVVDVNKSSKSCPNIKDLYD